MSRLVMFCLVALGVFMVVTDPTGAANLATSILGVLNTAAHSITTFLTSLGNGAVG